MQSLLDQRRNTGDREGSRVRGYSWNKVDATAEKITRGRLKFEVEKRLLGKTVVIIDSLNYIKGYRYQMFCIAREQKATYCVVFCNTPPEKALEFNKNSQKGFPE